MPILAHLLPALTGIFAFALALPNPVQQFSQPDPSFPVRILPPNWLFTIISLSGPGCPDFNDTLTSGYPFVTRPTFGSNTVDGSEIYYWHFAYPHLRAAVGAGAHQASTTTWCETTLGYLELDAEGRVPVQPGYRLRAHKNGTAVLARYELDDGVEARWTVRYATGQETGEGEVVDLLTIAGPRAAGSYRDISPVSKPVQWALPECGAGTIKFRTELAVTATKEGARGTVTSDEVPYEGRTAFYGVQVGISYDWEKCDV